MNDKALKHSLEYIKSWLAFRYERAEIPGYVVAVAHKGQVLLNEANGYADLQKKIVLTPQHIFRIASQSKTFTATALMQLAEQDKLRLDDYACQYLPWLKEHKDKRWQKVTIRQLMSHSAGVIRDGFNADFWQLESPFPDTDQLKKEIMEAELVVDNNTKLKYSNFGYSVLGLVIEAVSGQTYNTYVTEHVIKPLGLKNTGPEYTDDIEDKIVTGYTRKEVNTGRLPIAQVDTKAMSAATGFYSNAEDLVKYFSAQFVGSEKLLSDESKKEMQRTQWHIKPRGSHRHEDYGLGLDIAFDNDHRTIGHGGSFPGQSTKTMADPKDELVVVVLVNCIDAPAGWIAKSIYGIIDHYQKNTPKTKPKHNMLNLEGRYMSLWGITDIIVTGDKIVSVYPDYWEPFAEPDELEYVKENTLKITDTSSFDSEDEIVRFKLEDGKVKTVDYSGSTMWPEKVWLQRQKNRKIVDL